MQQLVETIRALQQTVTVSKADQDRILAKVIGFWLRFGLSRQPVKTDSKSIWMRHKQTTKTCAGPMRNCTEIYNA